MSRPALFKRRLLDEPVNQLNRPGRTQQGYAAITIVVVVGIAATALLMSSFDSTALRNEQERKTTAALALARQALIGRAAWDNARPGSLPCPDVNNDGVLTMNVDYLGGGNCASNSGRLPWRTLGLPDLRDANSERLWYALSPNFYDAAGVTIKDTTIGTLSVTGTTPATNVVAIIFSPGPTLDGQLRDTVANQNSVANYLDGANAAGGPAFTSQAASSNFNDRLAYIAVSDLMAVVERRVANEVTAALNSYFQATSLLPTPADINCVTGGNSTLCVPSGSTAAPGRLPSNGAAGLWPSLLGFNTWFDSSWRASLSYSVAPECTTTPACANNGFGLTAGGPPKVTLVVGSSTTLTVPLAAR